MYNNNWFDATLENSIKAMEECKMTKRYKVGNIGKKEIRKQNYDFSEMDMLEAYLEKHNFIYRRMYKFDGEAIVVFDNQSDSENKKQAWDCILHCGSYGHECGLLEGYGNIFGDEMDAVEGWLTAEEIIKRL